MHSITSSQELFERWDEIVSIIKAMIKKTGGHGQTPEFIMSQLVALVESPNSLILVHLDDEMIDVFLFAIALTERGTPWVEVVALWSKPGAAKQHWFEGFDILASWAKSLGADKILAALTRRHPEKFLEAFHAKVGFEKIGIIVERRL